MNPFNTIVNTATLIYLSKVEQYFPIREVLPNLFYSLLVPEKVVEEFNRGLIKHPEDYPFADAIDRGEFLEKCSTYDSGTLDLMKAEKNVHDGEAEAAAQQLIINSDFIWSDDKKFTVAIKKLLPSVKVFNSLHIVALLDLKNYIADYPDFILKLHSARPINEGNF